jgi:hypothetical protein
VAAETHRRCAELEYAHLYPILLELRGRGLSLAAIAVELARRGYKSRQGYTHWSPTQVARVLRRAEASRRAARPESPSPGAATP